MIQVQAIEKKCIDLGRRGEDSAREILFDITGFAELYGQGEALLIAKRDRDSNTYPAEITQNDTMVSWVIKPVDNDQPGYGYCELVYIAGGAVAKSIIYQTHVDVSLSDPVSPPDAPTTFESLKRDIGDLSKLKTEIKNNLVEALNSVYEKSVSSTDLDSAIDSALAKAKESGLFDGDTPYIKDDYWWVGNTNTNVKAQGISPHIGENGNWFIGETDTEVPATMMPEGSGLPKYTEADEGKFLRIIRGSPAWKSVINGEEVKF